MSQCSGAGVNVCVNTLWSLRVWERRPLRRCAFNARVLRDSQCLDARVNASVNVPETVVSSVRRPLPVLRACPPAVHAGVDRMRIMLA